MSKHAPGPWTLRKNPMRTDGYFIYGSYGEPILRSHVSPANAFHIVKCVNMHEELVDAIRGLLEIGKRDLSNEKYDGYFDALKAALAKAEGK